MGPDAATLLGLHELLTYGLRGVAAYAHHAEMLGQVDASLDDFFEVRRCAGGGRGGLGGWRVSARLQQARHPAPHCQPVPAPGCPNNNDNKQQQEVLAFLASPAAADPSAVLAKCMQLGEVNFRVMARLDQGHTTRFGQMEPSPVRLTPVKGPAILISGHDMQVGFFGWGGGC